MSVIDKKSEADENLDAILNELKIIDEQHNQREKIYQQCLNNYLNHLNTETEKLLSNANGVEQRNNCIRQSFQIAYDSIFNGTDRILRSTRRTFEAKRNFWEETIKDFLEVGDLEIKKQLYALKRDAEQRFQQIIDAQRTIKKIPFKRVFSKKEADKSLANFQDSNNTFEGKVYLGTSTANKFRPLQNTYFNNANKQNESSVKNTHRIINKGGQSDSILNQFVKK